MMHRHHRTLTNLLVSLLILSPHASLFTADAALSHYHETSGDWSDSISWPSSTIPLESDEVWMNTADTSLSISTDYTARIDKLIVGRHAMNTDLVINGGALLVGSGDNDVLFVGQYGDAEGTVTFNSGRVEVEGELAVAVAGKGLWVQDGGSVYVRDRFVIGRYTNTEAIGTVILRGGSITADRFDMNEYSTLAVQGGLLQLRGDHLSKVQAHIDGGRIVGYQGTLKWGYDSALDMTSVYVSRIFGYSGSGDWSNPTQWSYSVVPTNYDEVWMNNEDVFLNIPTDYTARIDKLIVGRHAMNTDLVINGGALLVGSGDNDVLFVGQYEDAEGTVTFNSGRVEVEGELAVAVAGKGLWVQDGGSVYVRDRFVIGRYTNTEAIGTVILRGGSIIADRFDMNIYSTLKLEGGIFVLNGNHMSKVKGYIDDGQIAGLDGHIPKLIYDDVSMRTYVYAKTDVTYTNYYGQVELFTTSRMLRSKASRNLMSSTDDFPSWFEPSSWSPQGLPGPGSEVWMNSPDTQALIGTNEIATANKMIVGRKVGVVTLAIDGGELLVGDDDSTSAILFVGQYSASNAKIIHKSGRIKVHGEFAVGVSGPGALEALGGRIDVMGRLVVGRYNQGSGNVLLNGGEIHVERLDINSNSVIDLQDGQMMIAGDDRNKMLNYISSGQITSHSTSSVSVVYNEAAQHTVLEGAATARPNPAPTPEPTNSPTTSGPTSEPTPEPTGQPSTSEPTSPPSPEPSRYISPEDWDVEGILHFQNSEIGPKLPQINRSINIREFTKVPDLGVHPRIFFSPEEIPRVRASLENTTVGLAAYTGAKQIISLLVYGRNSCGGNCYNDIPNEDKNLPNGKQKISNAGLFHTNPTYEDLFAGSCSMVESQGGTHTNVLGGGMAIEALDLLIFPEQVDAQIRVTKLTTAMSNWANCVLANPNFITDGAHGSAAARDLFGGQHLAFAYDMAYNFMTTEQRSSVRKAIATMIWRPEQFVGIDTEPYATTTNWVTINSFVPVMIMAIEGETIKEVEGWSTAELEVYFDQIMMANYKFLTYGYYEEGSGYEGAGKNYQYNAMMAAYAKRGYNFFTHPHVQAYGTKFLPALLQPYGNYITSYDTLGGSGLDPELGGQRFHANDIIGLKWAYPDDSAIDFIYRQYVETPYNANGSKQFFLDVYEQKITARSTYANAFLSLLIMPSDYNSEATFSDMSAAAHQDYTFYGKERGLVVTRSGFDERAAVMNFHVRQDMGGHTYGDRLSFSLSALGRLWVRNPVGYVPETEWSSGILVDGKGITIAPQDGRKARMPGRLVTHQDNPLSTFTFGDATYAFNVAWKWCYMCRPVGSNVGISGWVPVEETWNDFRSPTNQINHAYGDVPFVDYANWQVGGYTEGIHKQVVNNLSQVYRQAGLVRGQYPYTLIVDDLHKMINSATTEWQWLAQIPSDLTLVEPGQYTDANLDPARDIVFQEPSTTGSRKLLVRILNAEGSQPQGLSEFTEVNSDSLWGGAAWRLTIRRIAERPRFRVMLYPFDDGQPIPEYTISGNGSITIAWSNNLKDVIKFHPSVQTVGGVGVEITGIEITRSGNVKVIDTREQTPVPMDIRW